MGASFTEDNNTVIHYNPDGTLKVFENNIFFQQSDWFVKLEDANLYGIVVNPPVTQLYGRILFGENSALFNDSYRDGADNYFIKIY